jgi:hypothetical protein
LAGEDGLAYSSHRRQRVAQAERGNLFTLSWRLDSLRQAFLSTVLEPPGAGGAGAGATVCAVPPLEADDEALAEALEVLWSLAPAGAGELPCVEVGLLRGLFCAIWPAAPG